METNRSLEVFTKIYKPYKITKVNQVYIFYTMDGDYVIKLNPKIDYRKLYNYLYSRSFTYIPSLSVDSRDDMVVLGYQEDLNIDLNQKILDMIEVVGLLHSKTSYYKDVTLDRYKEIYQNIKDNLLFMDDYYDKYFNLFLESYYNSPSEYLLLRSYSVINGAIKYSLDNLDSWYNIVSTKGRERICLVHNNLKLEHFIKNQESYLVSWDHYTYDTLVLDLFGLYRNEWENVSFKEVIDAYNSINSMLEEEMLLFKVLISMPFKVIFDSNEYELCRNLRRLVSYLDKSAKMVLDN